MKGRLVALGSAAVIVVYTAGYVRTRAAADRWALEETRPAPPGRGSAGPGPSGAPDGRGAGAGSDTRPILSEPTEAVTLPPSVASAVAERTPTTPGPKSPTTKAAAAVETSSPVTQPRLVVVESAAPSA